MKSTNGKETKQVNGQWPLLGLLRFMLAMVVVLAHAEKAFGQGGKYITEYGSYAAVVGFFLISGYSIAASIERNPIGFYGRRALRIYPAYLAGFALALWYCHSVHRSVTTWQVICQLTMIQGVAAPVIYGFGQSWSLANEAAYYAVTPLLRRVSDKWLMWIIGLSFGAFMLHPWEARAKESVIALSWVWLVGFAAHRLKSHNVPLVGILPLWGISLFNQSGGMYSTQLVLLSALAITQAHKVNLTEQAAKWCVWLGDFSYALYIVHFPAMLMWGILAARWPEIAGSPSFGVMAAMASSLAVMVVIEKPTQWIFKHEWKWSAIGRRTATASIENAP